MNMPMIFKVLEVFVDFLLVPKCISERKYQQMFGEHFMTHWKWLNLFSRSYFLKNVEGRTFYSIPKWQSQVLSSHSKNVCLQLYLNVVTHIHMHLFMYFIDVYITYKFWTNVLSHYLYISLRFSVPNFKLAFVILSNDAVSQYF